MTDWRSMMDKTYLGSWDVPEGKDVVLVIARCEGATIKGTTGEEKRAPVLFFANTKSKKGMVLNSTNAKTIAKLYGRHVEGWVGKPIAIFATKTLAFGEEVECLRIRPIAPPLPKSSESAKLASVPREPGEEAETA